VFLELVWKRQHQQDLVPDGDHEQREHRMYGTRPSEDDVRDSDWAKKEFVVKNSRQLSISCAEHHFQKLKVTIPSDDPLVGAANFGDRLRLSYRCGGGGGHEIHVKNCKVRAAGLLLSHLNEGKDPATAIHTTSNLYRQLPSMDRWLQGDMLNLIQEGFFADVILVANENGDGGDINEKEQSGLRCHRCVLAARNKYFRALFSEQWSQAGFASPDWKTIDGASVIPMHGVHVAALAAFVSFLYSGKVPQNTELMSDGCSLAQTLLQCTQLYGDERTVSLKDAYEIALLCAIEEDNVGDLKDVAENFNLPMLSKIVEASRTAPDIVKCILYI
jgi:hypothetical protein